MSPPSSPDPNTTSPTLAQVAKAAGVSAMTVSNAMRGKQAMKATTRQRVVEIAQQMGYRPNTAARANRTGKFKAVGLLQSTIGTRSSTSDALMSGIHRSLIARDHHLVVSAMPDEKLTQEGFLPQVLGRWCVDGLLINYTDHLPDRLTELIEQQHLPALWMNARRDSHCVYPDNLGASENLTRHLLNLGHTRIAYINLSNARLENDDPHFSVIDREAGYCRDAVGGVAATGDWPGLFWGSADAAARRRF